MKCNFHIWNCMWNFCKERKFEKIALNVSDTETVLPMGTDRFVPHLLWAKVQVRYIFATYISKLSRFSNKKLHQSLLMYSGFRLGRTYISKHVSGGITTAKHIYGHKSKTQNPSNASTSENSWLFFYSPLGFPLHGYPTLLSNHFHDQNPANSP